MKNPLDKIVRRFHATNNDGLQRILKNFAIRPYPSKTPVYDEKGEYILRTPDGKRVYEERIRPIFTSTPTSKLDWIDNRKDTDFDVRKNLIHIEIPQSVYSTMKRTDINPDYAPAIQRKGLGLPYNVISKDRGGTADFFMEELPLDYVKKICLDGNKDCHSVEEIIKMLGIER